MWDGHTAVASYMLAFHARTAHLLPLAHLFQASPAAPPQLGDAWKDVFSRTALLFFVVAFLTFMRWAGCGGLKGGTV